MKANEFGCRASLSKSVDYKVDLIYPLFIGHGQSVPKSIHSSILCADLSSLIEFLLALRKFRDGSTQSEAELLSKQMMTCSYSQLARYTSYPKAHSLRLNCIFISRLISNLQGNMYYRSQQHTHPAVKCSYEHNSGINEC